MTLSVALHLSLRCAMTLQSLKQVDEHLIYWPSQMIHRVKVRLTRMKQCIIRMRALTKKVVKKVVPINRKVRSTAR